MQNIELTDEVIKYIMSKELTQNQVKLIQYLGFKKQEVSKVDFDSSALENPVFSRNQRNRILSYEQQNFEDLTDIEVISFREDRIYVETKLKFPKYYVSKENPKELKRYWIEIDCRITLKERISN